ncbi:MAG: LamG-like jellyroll fold domain-containing protein, partial [Chitinophagaceae bacterium]
SGTGTYTKTGHCNAERLIVPYSTPPVNSWKQWVITINGSVQKIYIDGVLQTPSFDANFLTPTYVAGRYVLLGAMVNTDGNSVYQDGVWNFKGKLDEFRIYNNAMTDAQVAAEYSGMEAYYPFNGNANDESGNNHNGTVTEAVLTTDKNGTANKAYQFDGVNDMITAPAHADWSFGNGDFSITSWVNVSTIGTSRIVSAGYTANDGIWGLGFGNHPVWGAGIRINYFVHSGGDYHDYSSNEITGYSIGQWAFVGITKTGSTLTFYFNGQQAGTATIPYVSNANSFLSIGSRQLTSGTNIEFFNGKIDEVRIYNRTLSPNEIQQLADVPMMPDLVAYLPMNGNANDMSGNGHNGTVSEATLTTDKYNSSNSAYEFPTANSNITLANSTGLNFNTSGFTLSSWIKYSNIDGVIIAKHNCWTPNGYLFSVNNNQLAFWLANGGNWASVTTAESFINDKWYFVTAVYDGVGLAYIYVDGVMKAGNAVVYNNINTAPVIISGASNGCPPPVNYHGSIDEVKIYGTPLDAAQVMTLYKESRGSGKAMKFDGVDDFVSIPNGG